MITETFRSGPSFVHDDFIGFRKAVTWNPGKHVLPDFAQEKLDGLRVIVYRGGVYTTRGHDISDQAQLPLNHISEFGWSHIWDGELVSSAGTRENVKTALKEGAVTFRPFATSAVSDFGSLSLVQHAIQVHTPFEPIPYYPAPGPENRDIEGYVYKSHNYGDWYKFKYERTIDAVVTSVKDGRKSLKGLVGSLVCSVRKGTSWVEIANVSGMTFEEREAMSVDEDLLVGQVVEIKYQRVGSRGRLLHPRFIGFRSDKEAYDCDILQDPDLTEALRHRTSP